MALAEARFDTHSTGDRETLAWLCQASVVGLPIAVALTAGLPDGAPGARRSRWYVQTWFKGFVLLISMLIVNSVVSTGLLLAIPDFSPVWVATTLLLPFACACICASAFIVPVVRRWSVKTIHASVRRRDTRSIVADSLGLGLAVVAFGLPYALLRPALSATSPALTVGWLVLYAGASRLAVHLGWVWSVRLRAAEQPRE